MKKLSLIALVAGIALLTAGVALADVPPPPVNQQLGFDDIDYGELELADCKVCHTGSTADRHHMLYGSSMPQGICAATTGLCQDGLTECANDVGCEGLPGVAECTITPRECYTDADCEVTISLCSNGSYVPGVSECTDASVDCGRQYQNPECTTTPYCAGTSAAANVTGSQDNGGVYGCLTCHEEDTSGSVINFLVERDCTVCHVQLPNSPSVHHLDEAQVLAKDGKCKECHGDIVDNMDDGHAIPTYDPSLVTPGSVTTERQCTETGWGPAVPCTDDADCAVVSPTSVCDPELHKSDTAEAGSCDFCHAPGVDTDSGLNVVSSYDTHHHTGVYKDRYGNTVDLGTGDSRHICSWCHYTGYPHNPGAYDPIEIRTCENCHGMESLHSIQADSPAAGNIGTIVVGGELAGYGHIGEDTPGADSDCWGCHGFSMADESVELGSGIPSINSATPQSIVANTPTSVTITGAALVSAGASSLARLTAADGTTVTIEPDSLSIDTMTVTIDAPAGIYILQAVKDGEGSSAIGFTVTPQVAITDMDCSKCLGTMTITGSGFGEKPAGTDEDISVTEGDRPLNVIEWTDDQITAAGARCSGDVVVNSVYGSSQ